MKQVIFTLRWCTILAVLLAASSPATTWAHGSHGSSGGSHGSSGGSSGGWWYSHGSHGGWYGSHGSSGGSSGGWYSHGSSGGYVAPATAPAPAPAYSLKSNTQTRFASVVVKLPADAKLFAQNKPTQSTGQLRRFVTPPLGQDAVFAYELKAELVRDGRTLTKTLHIRVQAGQQTTVEFSLPTRGASELIASIN